MSLSLQELLQGKVMSESWETVGLTIQGFWQGCSIDQVQDMQREWVFIVFPAKRIMTYTQVSEQIKVEQLEIHNHAMVGVYFHLLCYVLTGPFQFGNSCPSGLENFLELIDHFLSSSPLLSTPTISSCWNFCGLDVGCHGIVL